MVGGCSLLRHSNFFTVTVDSILDDKLWIKTCSADTGVVPRTCIDYWASPWIVPDPDPPEFQPTINKLYVTVGNLDLSAGTGLAEVEAKWNHWPGFAPYDSWPDVDPSNPSIPIANILPGGTETVEFTGWEIPDIFTDNHICTFAQAYRSGEPRSPAWDVINNNNVAQRNHRAASASSPYTTTLDLNNPTNKTITYKFYMEPPNMNWVCTLCDASYIEDGKVVTPVMIPPGEEINLNLTINLPPGEDSGTVTIQYIVEGYERIYPDISYFGFDVYRDAVPPVIEITRPKGIYLFDKELIPLPFDFALVIGPITINANATDEESGMNRVEFYVDNEHRGTDYEEPYEWLWGNSTGFFGKHSIKAKAYDHAENSISSKEITVLKFL